MLHGEIPFCLTTISNVPITLSVCHLLIMVASMKLLHLRYDEKYASLISSILGSWALSWYKVSRQFSYPFPSEDIGAEQCCNKLAGILCRKGFSWTHSLPSRSAGHRIVVNEGHMTELLGQYFPCCSYWHALWQTRLCSATYCFKHWGKIWPHLTLCVRY